MWCLGKKNNVRKRATVTWLTFHSILFSIYEVFFLLCWNLTGKNKCHHQYGHLHDHQSRAAGRGHVEALEEKVYYTLRTYEGSDCVTRGP